MEGDASNRGRLWAYSIIGFLLVLSAWYYATNPVYIYIVAYMWFGFSYGVLQQWGRFCFASAWRDLIGLRVTRMYVGLMIAVIILAFVIAVLEVAELSTFHAAPLGLHEVLGGLIFGVGMTFAGGCATGTLYKTGEGNLTSATALFAMIFAQPLFVDFGSTGKFGTSYFDKFLTGYTFKQPQYRLSEYFTQYGNGKYFVGDWIINVVIPVSILLVLTYLIVVKKDDLAAKVRAGESTSMSFGDYISGFKTMITASKRTTTAGLLIGIVGGLNVLVIQGLRDRYAMNNFGTALSRMGYEFPEVGARGTVFDPGHWYVTSQEAQFGGWILEKLGLTMHDNMFLGVINAMPHPIRNPLLWMSIGLILGAAVMSMLSGEFKWKVPNRELFTYGLVGGTLMGIGSRLALGCNIGGFYTRTAGGDPGGWVFFIGMGGGAFVAVKFMKWWTERSLADVEIDIDI